MTAVKFREVWKEYPDGTRALKDVSLSVEEGEFVGVMGPSGSGKSTLLHIAGTLDKPTKGEVEILGTDVTGMSEEELTRFRRGRIAFVFQFYYLLEDFTTLENLLIVGELLGVKDPETKAESLLDRLRLSHRKRHKPYQLSGGERQRVAIARALMGDPDLILADEPTGNVDWEEGRRIFEFFKLLNKERGITFMVATHNTELKDFFDRIIYLKDGRLC